MSDTPPTTALRDLVTITLPADGVYLSVVRTATAALAARLNFTLDDIEDLRIAVDEACALLVSVAVPDGDLRCEFELLDATMVIDVSAVTPDGQPPAHDTFAWTVLTALAGEVESSVDDDFRVRIQLRKRMESR